MNVNDAKTTAIINRWGIFAICLAFAGITWRFLGSPSYSVLLSLVVIELYGYFTFNIIRFNQNFRPLKPMTIFSGQQPEGLINIHSRMEALEFNLLRYLCRTDIVACFANESGTVYSLVNALSPEKFWVTFSTRYEDGAYLITTAPSGENISSKTYIANAAIDAISALTLHNELIEKMATSHGEVLPVLSLQDVIKADLFWEKVHKRTHFQRQIRLTWLLNIVTFMTAVVGIVGVIVQLNLPKLDQGFIVLPLLIMISVDIYVRRFIKARWEGRGRV